MSVTFCRIGTFEIEAIRRRFRAELLNVEFFKEDVINVIEMI